MKCFKCRKNVYTARVMFEGTIYCEDCADLIIAGQKPVKNMVNL